MNKQINRIIGDIEDFADDQQVLIRKALDFGLLHSSLEIEDRGKSLLHLHKGEFESDTAATLRKF